MAKPKPFPDFSLLSELRALGYQKIVGLDEVGRGAVAGPIVVAAVQLSLKIIGITDSKLLTKKQRESLDKEIRLTADNIHIGEASNQEIDKFGISSAQKLAYQRALEGLEADLYLTDYYHLDNLPYLTLPKGDQMFYPVAAASIVAKVYRDNLMSKHSEQFPNYDWTKNVGYGTKKHFDAILKHGRTPLHRKSFLNTVIVP